MYTLEERMKAVELYIQSGFSEGAVIRTLGYPSHTALRYWYKEYLLNGELHEASVSKPRYTEAQKAAAVAYYAANQTSLVQPNPSRPTQSAPENAAPVPANNSWQR